VGAAVSRRPSQRSGHARLRHPVFAFPFVSWLAVVKQEKPKEKNTVAPTVAPQRRSPENGHKKRKKRQKGEPERVWPRGRISRPAFFCAFSCFLWLFAPPLLLQSQEKQEKRKRQSKALPHSKIGPSPSAGRALTCWPPCFAAAVPPACG